MIDSRPRNMWIFGLMALLLLGLPAAAQEEPESGEGEEAEAQEMEATVGSTSPANPGSQAYQSTPAM